MTTHIRSFGSCLLFVCLFTLGYNARGQKLDTLSTFSITGYIDAYYAYYNDSVGSGNFQKFPSISPRSNNPSLNTAQLSFLYNATKVRGAAVFHFGDIASSAWAAEPYNHIMEAHVGFKIYRTLWLDAGFFRTHFGTEYLLPSENITSSVSVGTVYEPYYESGFRLDWFPVKRLEIQLYLLNSYGTFTENNEKKSLGTNIAWLIKDNLCLGYTNYIGDDSPVGDTIKHLRTHQNMYINYQYKKFKVVAGFDYCMQQHSDIKDGTKTGTMSSGLATVKFQATSKFGIYTRGEYFSDPNAIMSARITDYQGKATGYKVTGVTLGAEFKPTDESYVRLEGRMLQMDKDQYIFIDNGKLTNGRFEIMVNAGITFDLIRNVRTRIIEHVSEPATGSED
jgi:Putative beta-barrel porin-2, OmpL-like. bbp2